MGLALRLFFDHRDVVHLSPPRSGVAPVDERIDVAWITFEHRFNPPIREVADESSQPQISSSGCALGPKEHALHLARDQDPHSLGCHRRLLRGGY